MQSGLPTGSPDIFENSVAFYNCIVYNTIQFPGVAQLVGRLVWDQDAASSSLATRTKNAGMA